MQINNKGYTLIELAVVVFIIGIMLTFAAPRVRDMLWEDNLKKAARQFTAAAKELRHEAVREQVDYILHFDLNKGEFWRYSADMTPEKRDEMKKSAWHLEGGVKITDMYHIGGNKQSDGEIRVRFFKKGYCQPTVIHLSSGDNSSTVVINPFLEDVTVHNSYIDFEEAKSL